MHPKEGRGVAHPIGTWHRHAPHLERTQYPFLYAAVKVLVRNFQGLLLPPCWELD